MRSVDNLTQIARLAALEAAVVWMAAELSEDRREALIMSLKDAKPRDNYPDRQVYSDFANEAIDNLVSNIRRY